MGPLNNMQNRHQKKSTLNNSNKIMVTVPRCLYAQNIFFIRNKSLMLISCPMAGVVKTVIEVEHYHKLCRVLQGAMYPVKRERGCLL